MNARKFKAGQLLRWNTTPELFLSGMSYSVADYGSLNPLFTTFYDRNEDGVMLYLAPHNESYALCLLGDQLIVVEWYMLKELK